MNDDARYVPTKYDSIFWIELDKIRPNPFQPRREFDEERLAALASSIRQYGVLQPIVVTREDVEREDGLGSAYELISGERRLRASKLAGLKTIPAVIRAGESNLTKLELAIIENLQREDLNAIDRARALAKLVEEFGISHAEVGAKIGKSREYVSNSLRLLALPESMQQAVVNKEIREAHARTLLSLNDKPEERETLFREIILKKLPVHAAERIARSIAQARVRTYHRKTAEMAELEKSLTETLGTRVIIEAHAEGGRLSIEFFSSEDLTHLAEVLAAEQARSKTAPVPPSRAESRDFPVFPNTTPVDFIAPAALLDAQESPSAAGDAPEARIADEPSEDDLYSISGFSV